MTGFVRAPWSKSFTPSWLHFKVETLHDVCDLRQLLASTSPTKYQLEIRASKQLKGQPQAFAI